MDMKGLKLSQKQMNIAVIVILAVAIFAISLILALLGSRVYENSDADSRQRSVSDAASYFTEQLRGCESSAHVRVASLKGEIPALVITMDDDSPGADDGNSGADDAGSSGQADKDVARDNDDTTLEAWYFVYDGSLHRAVINSGDTVSPASGEIIMPLHSVGFSTLRGGLVEISFVTGDGDSSTINISLAGGGDAGE